MNHSLLSADRNTHFKIAAVALLAGLLVVGIGLKTRGTETGSPGIETGQVAKAGKPAIYTRTETSAVR